MQGARIHSLQRRQRSDLPLPTSHILAAPGNKRVALFDFNLQFGDASMFIQDSLPTTSIADVARQIQRLDGSFLHPVWSGIADLGVLAAPEKPKWLRDKARAHQSLVPGGNQTL
jgi:Flp pilus assembly CpaE family ATPase